VGSIREGRPRVAASGARGAGHVRTRAPRLPSRDARPTGTNPARRRPCPRARRAPLAPPGPSRRATAGDGARGADAARLAGLVVRSGASGRGDARPRLRRRLTQAPSVFWAEFSRDDVNPVPRGSARDLTRPRGAPCSMRRLIHCEPLRVLRRLRYVSTAGCAASARRS
jgi:hypothetical protein